MLTSLDNKKVKEWNKLHNKKYRVSNFLLLDEPLVKIAKEKRLLNTLIYVDNKPFDFENSFQVSKEVMHKISKKDNVSFIGISNFLNENSDYKKRILLLEDLQDPINIGTIIKTACAFNFDSIILSNNSADIYNQKCIETAGESFFNINIIHKEIDNAIHDLKKLQFNIYATGLKKYSKELYEVNEKEKMAFILGNEGSGVKEETMNIADEVIKIDMNNIDSLNVAMAAAIIMYRFKI